MTTWTHIPASIRETIEHTAHESGVDLDGIETVADVLDRIGDLADQRALGDGATDPTIRERLADLAAYTVTIQEDGDEGARWLHGVAANTPEDAALAAQAIAMQRGYGAEGLARVYAGHVSGTTLGHTALAEVRLRRDA